MMMKGMMVYHSQHLLFSRQRRWEIFLHRSQEQVSLSQNAYILGGWLQTAHSLPLRSRQVSQRQKCLQSIWNSPSRQCPSWPLQISQRFLRLKRFCCRQQFTLFLSMLSMSQELQIESYIRWICRRRIRNSYNFLLRFTTGSSQPIWMIAFQQYRLMRSRPLLETLQPRRSNSSLALQGIWMRSSAVWSLQYHSPRQLQQFMFEPKMQKPSLSGCLHQKQEDLLVLGQGRPAQKKTSSSSLNFSLKRCSEFLRCLGLRLRLSSGVGSTGTGVGSCCEEMGMVGFVFGFGSIFYRGFFFYISASFSLSSFCLCFSNYSCLILSACSARCLSSRISFSTCSTIDLNTQLTVIFNASCCSRIYTRQA